MRSNVIVKVSLFPLSVLNFMHGPMYREVFWKLAQGRDNDATLGLDTGVLKITFYLYATRGITIGLKYNRFPVIRS